MNEKINLKELVHLLADKSGIQKKDAEAFLREFFDTIDEALFADQLVKVKDLGSFKLTLVNDRESVDVLTKKRVLIPAHYKVTYSPDNDLAQVVNEPFSLFETVEINEDAETNESSESDDSCNADEINAVEKVDIVEELPVVEAVAPEKVEEVEDVLPQIEPAQIMKQPVEKRKAKSTSNTIYICCCIVALLLGAGFYYYLSNEEADISSSVSSRNLTIESDPDKIFEDDVPEIIEEIPQDTIIEGTFPHVQKEEPAIPSSEKKTVVPEKTVAPVSTPPATVESNTALKKRTVQSGERLTLIALEEYGDKNFWIYIYEENKSTIKNPNNVSSGLTIIIPPASKYGIDKNNEESIKKAEELAKQYKK